MRITVENGEMEVTVIRRGRNEYGRELNTKLSDFDLMRIGEEFGKLGAHCTAATHGPVSEDSEDIEYVFTGRLLRF